MKTHRWLKVLIILIFIIPCVIGYLYLTRTKKIELIRVGEQMVYYIYRGENRVGTFTMEVPMSTRYQGVKCYQANYQLVIENSARSGSILFDDVGRLRYYAGYFKLNDSVQWVSEIIPYWTLNKVRVIVAYPNLTTENELEMPAAMTAAEHFLYLIRMERLGYSYYREFNFIRLPDATQTTAGGVEVVGEDEVNVVAGSYDCWVLEVSGGWEAKIWVSKRERIVPKFVEGDLIYTLQEKRYREHE